MPLKTHTYTLTSVYIFLQSQFSIWVTPGPSEIVLRKLWHIIAVILTMGRMPWCLLLSQQCQSTEAKLYDWKQAVMTTVHAYMPFVNSTVLLFWQEICQHVKFCVRYSELLYCYYLLGFCLTSLFSGDYSRFRKGHPKNVFGFWCEIFYSLGALPTASKDWRNKVALYRVVQKKPHKL